MKYAITILVLLCAATALQAAVSFVQGEENAATGVSSISKAFDSNNASPNTIIVAGAAFMTSAIANDFAFTDTQSNAYNYVNSGNLPSGIIGFGSSLFYAEPIASGANTVTMVNYPPSPITGDLDIVETELAGGTGGVDQSPAAFICNTLGTCPATTIDGPSITTTKTETLIATIYDKHTAHTWTISSGWTICAKCVTSNPGNETLALAYHLNAAAGTYQPVWTNGGAASSGLIAITASFFPNSTGSVRHKAIVY